MCVPPPTLSHPAWQMLPKPVQSVNEVEDPGRIAGTFWLKEGLSVCQMVVDWVEVVLLHPCKMWVVSLWWGCGGMSFMSWCAFRCC